jgi:hypothetical protein
MQSVNKQFYWLHIFLYDTSQTREAFELISTVPFQLKTSLCAVGLDDHDRIDSMAGTLCDGPSCHVHWHCKLCVIIHDSHSKSPGKFKVPRQRVVQIENLTIDEKDITNNIRRRH